MCKIWHHAQLSPRDRRALGASHNNGLSHRRLVLPNSDGSVHVVTEAMTTTTGCQPFFSRVKSVDRKMFEEIPSVTGGIVRVCRTGTWLERKKLVQSHIEDWHVPQSDVSETDSVLRRNATMGAKFASATVARRFCSGFKKSLPMASSVICNDKKYASRAAWAKNN